MFSEAPFWVWIVAPPAFIICMVIVLCHWKRRLWGFPRIEGTLVILFIIPVCLTAPVQPQVKTCAPCIVNTTKDGKVTSTLIFSTQQPPECEHAGTICQSKGMVYHLCNDTSGTSHCYRPEVPIHYNYSVWAGMAKTEVPLRKNPAGGGRLLHLDSKVVLKQGTEPVELVFNACTVTVFGLGPWCHTSDGYYKAKAKYLCQPHRGWKFGNPEKWTPCATSAACNSWTCVCEHTGRSQLQPFKPCAHIAFFRRGDDNTVILGINRTHPSIEVYGFGIATSGYDPKGYITVTRTTLREGNKRNHTWTEGGSALDRLQDDSLEIPDIAKNSFVGLAQSIATELGVSDCYVCGGTNMGQAWPWEAMEINPELFNNLSRMGNFTTRDYPQKLVWTISTELVGQVCFSQEGTIPVGSLACLGTWEKGAWKSPSGMPPPAKLTGALLSYIYSDLPVPWEAPLNLYWICGSFAYEMLPASWSGSCVLGFIKPSFFLIPTAPQQSLAAPVYGPLSREKRGSLKREGTPFEGFDCKHPDQYHGDTWDSERIICVYGPATWAADGSWGYRTPIYMLNRIIRLQAVLDLAGQRISSALTALAVATDKLRTAVYQNRLALDYLLAAENGVCGKWNMTNCCLEIDPVGDVINQLTTEIKQLTVNPAQEWKGLQLGWLQDLLPGGWLKAIIGMVVAPLCILLLICLLAPCLIKFLQTSILRMVAQRAAPEMLALLQDYDRSREQHPLGNLLP